VVASPPSVDLLGLRLSNSTLDVAGGGVGAGSLPPRMTADLRADVTHLASIERLPCSPGERQAAEWIAQRLRESGARVTIDEEPVHGTYFAPIGLLNALAALGGVAALSGRRVLGATAGATAAASLYQDLSGGPRRWLRRRLPQRPTWNVVAELGDRDAAHTLVVHAHHDAARTSFIFDQGLPRLIATRMPWLLRRMDRWPPLMGLVVLGPVLVLAAALTGSRRAGRVGTAASALTAAMMARMSREPVVPGANDNLSGVAVLLEVARRLHGRAPPGLRIVLLSAGAEESNQDGMLAFMRRHGGDLPPASTTFLCLDTVGSPELVLLEGEGFLRMRDYPAEARELVAEAAADARVHLRRGLRFTFATDALVPLRQGYQVGSLGSVNDWLVPSNYHWPTDTAENVDYDSVSGTADIVVAVAERLARRQPARQGDRLVGA
jgi:hypothetical protein